MNLKHYPLILSLVLLIFSCKKNNDESTANDFAKKIHGKWQIGSIVISQNLNGVVNEMTQEGEPSDYIEFKTDGKMQTSLKGQTEVSEYYVNETERKINIDGDNASIIELTENSLIIYDKDRTATIGYTEITYNLKR